MNQAQETICNIILAMISLDSFRDNIRTSGFKYIFGQTIRQYAEINNEYKKTWKNIGLCKVHHQFTERAVNILRENPNANNHEIWQLLHYEHIVPICSLIRQLIDLYPNNINFQSISIIMQQNQVIILTKEEAKVLDGSVTFKYPLDGEVVLGLGMKTRGENKRAKIKCNKCHYSQ